MVSLTPSSGTGLTQTFTVVVTDPSGIADLSQWQLLFNDMVGRSYTCNVSYNPGTHNLYLYNDVGTTLSAAVVPGSATQVSSNQCTLSGARSSYSSTGNNLTVSVALTFTEWFTGQQNAYVLAQGKYKLNSGWLQMGTWTVPPQQLRLAPPPQPVPETYFGMHMHRSEVQAGNNKYVTPWPNVPIGVWRLLAAKVEWFDLDPRKNEFNFALLDKYVAIAQQKHVKLLLPLYGSPALGIWAHRKSPHRLIPQAPAEPADMNDCTVATRYKGQIEAYEVWNEPNLKESWTGSVEQLVDMSREAFRIIRSVDPAALVVLPSCTSWGGPQYLDDFLKKGGGQFGDVIGYHFYVHTNPEAMAPVAKRVEDVMRANHVAKPLWNTETGWFVPKPFPSDDLAAAYVARALILAWAAGISRFYWYSWDNHGWVSVEMVERDDVTLKPAAKAYRVIQQWLTGAIVRSCESDSANNWTCELQRGGARQWIVWNADRPVTFAVPADWHATYDTPLLGSKEKLSNTTIEIGPTSSVAGAINESFLVQTRSHSFREQNRLSRIASAFIVSP